MTFYKPEDYTQVNCRHYLIDQYLDYKNNYLSPDLFAEHRGIDLEQAKALIDIGRDLFNTKHPEAQTAPRSPQPEGFKVGFTLCFTQ